MYNVQQLSPVIVSLDCLNSTRYLVLRDSYGAMESTTPLLRQAYENMLREHLQMADEWYRFLHNRGWYMVPEPQSNVISYLNEQLGRLNSMPTI